MESVKTALSVNSAPARSCAKTYGYWEIKASAKIRPRYFLRLRVFRAPFAISHAKSGYDILPMKRSHKQFGKKKKPTWSMTIVAAARTFIPNEFMKPLYHERADFWTDIPKNAFLVT
jgi:hypothetical protein